MSDNGKIVGAVLLGAAVGAVLGLLFAPSKGSDLRKRIAEKTGDILDKFTDNVSEGKDVLSELKTKATSKADELKYKAENEFHGIKEKVKQTAANVHSSTTSHTP